MTSIRSYATLRDGRRLHTGRRVTTQFDRCEGRVFVIHTITAYGACESGTMVLVHLEGHPDRLLRGGTGLGLDANWFNPADDPTAPSP